MSIIDIAPNLFFKLILFLNYFDISIKYDVTYFWPRKNKNKKYKKESLKDCQVGGRGPRWQV
jgi:hypothetical protein